MKKIKIGIIGCGVIGSALAEFLHRRLSRQTRLAWLCDFHPGKIEKIRKRLGFNIPAASYQDLIRKSDFIIEAASPEVACRVVRDTAKHHKKALILSVGGLLNFKNPEKLLQGKVKIWIPSGAVAGIDGLLAAREAGILSVKLTIKKSPQGLEEAPYFKKKSFPSLRPKEKKCIFRGNALAAVRGFPKNANVAALLSLAGTGVKKTRVEIWTSRQYRKNSHEIEIHAKSGTLKYEIRNIPSKANPKTSALAIFSACADLRKIFNALVLGT